MGNIPQKQMNVLIDTSPLSNAHAIRGVGVYTRFLTRELEKLNNLTVKRSGELGSDEEFRADLVHYPFFDLFFDTLPLVKKNKTVVTIHDVIPLKFPEHYQPGIKGRLRFEKQKVALKTVQAVVTDSKASKLDIVKYLGVPKNKVHVVYLAGNPEIEEIGPRAVGKVKQDYGLPDDYILYVGDINYNKNIPQLIKSVKYLPEKISLVLLGKNFKEQDIPEWQWIKTQVAMSEVGHRVVFLPEILGNADQELSAIYTGARAYVQPSLYEGFGLPVLEAMQCKTPVVCAENSSLLEVGGSHVFYAKSEAESMSKAVEAALELNTSQRHDWVNQAYVWSQTFSWQKTAKNTSRVYQQILGQ